MDERSWQVVEAVRAFMDDVVQQARNSRRARSPITEPVAAHLGTDALELPVVSEEVPAHQLVNLDVAMEMLLAEQGGGRLLGVGGGDQRQHHSFGEMLERADEWGTFGVAAPDYANLPVGPDEQRQVVSFGLHLFRYRGVPVAVLQRGASEQSRRGGASVEVLAAEGVAADLLAEVRRLMVQHSVFRGQVLTLGAPSEPYRPGIGGITFHHRPNLTPQDVVLPDGVLARVERHVGGAARHREVLLAAGQHLKRGLLLYGPPGTGKTHTVRYLAGALPGTTVILLSGSSLQFIGAAADLARSLQPALVVLEDVDLIAEQRDLHHDPQPLLFTVLEAMDGLASDADIGFVLTTNRADLLEPALAQRPGRVDLAIEIGLPDAVARRRLLTLYARGMGFSATVLDDVAERSAGTTASFAKELVRRAVLDAAEQSQPVGDDALLAALEELLDESQRITRVLLGSADQA